MNDELNELYQQVILDHSRKPRNFGILKDANHSAEGNNPLCGDHYAVYLKLENDVIKDVSFDGSGCAISKAAGSIMTDFLKGKTIAGAQKYFGMYQQMVMTGKADEEVMGKLYAFAGVHNFPMRVKCAVLSWHALIAGLKGENKVVSTEEPKSPGF
jgi:nitrogen fixation NifU-like protein